MNVATTTVAADEIVNNHLGVNNCPAAPTPSVPAKAVCACQIS